MLLSCFVGSGDLLTKNAEEMLIVTALGSFCSFLKLWVLATAEVWLVRDAFWQIYVLTHGALQFSFLIIYQKS